MVLGMLECIPDVTISWSKEEPVIRKNPLISQTKLVQVEYSLFELVIGKDVIDLIEPTKVLNGSVSFMAHVLNNWSGDITDLFKRQNRTYMYQLLVGWIRSAGEPMANQSFNLIWLLSKVGTDSDDIGISWDKTRLAKIAAERVEGTIT